MYYISESGRVYDMSNVRRIPLAPLSDLQGLEEEPPPESLHG